MLGGDEGQFSTQLKRAMGLVRICLPFGTLAHKDLDNGALLQAKNLKENTRTLCLYPHNSTYYEPIILKIVKKRKLEPGIYFVICKLV